MGTGSDQKCPICFHVLKYLWERTHKPAISSITGKEYQKHSFTKRAQYCKRCDVVYPLGLKTNVEELKHLI